MSGNHSHILREIDLFNEEIAWLPNNTLLDVPEGREWDDRFIPYENNELIFVSGNGNNVRLARLERNWETNATWKARLL